MITHASVNKYTKTRFQYGCVHALLELWLPLYALGSLPVLPPMLLRRFYNLQADRASGKVKKVKQKKAKGEDGGPLEDEGSPGDEGSEDEDLGEFGVDEVASDVELDDDEVDRLMNEEEGMGDDLLGDPDVGNYDYGQLMDAMESESEDDGEEEEEEGEGVAGGDSSSGSEGGGDGEGMEEGSSSQEEESEGGDDDGDFIMLGQAGAEGKRVAGELGGAGGGERGWRGRGRGCRGRGERVAGRGRRVQG